MPKYQVLQPIEKNNVLYVPKDFTPAKALPSASHGKLVPVDASGEIELTEEEAATLIHGQVPLIQGKPDPIGGAEVREKKAREEAEKAAAKAEAEKAEYEEFAAFRAAKAAKKAKAADTKEQEAQEDSAVTQDESKGAKKKK